MNHKKFLSKVNKTRGCWQWLGTVGADGYGEFWTGNKIEKSHRISWRLEYDNLPDRLCVLHKCDNRLCVNPKHLWLGDRAANNRDRAEKGRNGNLKGESNGRSKLSLSDVYKIREAYASGSYSQEKLARVFGVTKSTVGKLLRGDTWTVTPEMWLELQPLVSES